MKKAIIYKKEECVFIRSINIDSNIYTFFVAIQSKRILYLKELHSQNNVTYASLNKLINLFPQYKSPAIFNAKILLDTFTNSVNYKIRNGSIADSDELLEIIYQFEKVINDPYIKQMTDSKVTTIFNKQAMFEVTNTIKKLEGKYKKTSLADLLKLNTETSSDVFLSQNWLNDSVDNKQLVYDSITKSRKKHRKSPIDFIFNNKVLNIYMIILVVAVVSFASSLQLLVNWKQTGDEAKNEIENIKEEVLVEQKTSNSNTTSNKRVVSSNSNTSTKKKTNISTRWGAEYTNYVNYPLYKVDFTKLKQKNGDTVAWIYINNTNVNYPVVQSRDNSYYLTHTFQKKYNVAGWIFADYRSNFKKYKSNTIIYGHGRTDDVMFGSLERTLKKNWYTNSNNWIINLKTPYADTYWHIVSVYVIPQESYYLRTTFENNSDYQKWINKMLSRSTYNFVKHSKSFEYGKNPPNTKDKFLTLQTCKDYNGNRIIVQAVLVDEK